MLHRVLVERGRDGEVRICEQYGARPRNFGHRRTRSNLTFSTTRAWDQDISQPTRIVAKIVCLVYQSATDSSFQTL
jgi:hypothetical protein